MGSGVGATAQRKIIATSPVVKMGAQTLNELCIQLKENPLIKRGPDGENQGYVAFDQYNLQDVENAFE